MTIVAGFKFDGGVVICADTQETIGPLKRNVPKLRFESADSGGSDLAVAFCGATDNGPFLDKVIDLAWKKAKDAADLEEASFLIEQSVKDTYREFGTIYQVGYMPSAELILGIKIGGKSSLFHGEGPVINERKEYAVGGVGVYLAEFLAGRMYSEYQCCPN